MQCPQDHLLYSQPTRVYGVVSYLKNCDAQWGLWWHLRVRAYTPPPLPLPAGKSSSSFYWIYALGGHNDTSLVAWTLPTLSLFEFYAGSDKWNFQPSVLISPTGEFGHVGWPFWTKAACLVITNNQKLLAQVWWNIDFFTHSTYRDDTYLMVVETKTWRICLPQPWKRGRYYRRCSDDNPIWW